MGKKLQILFSCSFLFHLMHLKASVLGKCFIQLPGCSHQPQLSQESIVPVKSEHKKRPFQTFYNWMMKLVRDHLYSPEHPSSLPGEKPAPLAICLAAVGAGHTFCGPRTSSGFVHPSGRGLPLAQPGMLQSKVPNKQEVCSPFTPTTSAASNFPGQGHAAVVVICPWPLGLWDTRETLRFFLPSLSQHKHFVFLLD